MAVIEKTIKVQSCIVTTNSYTLESIVFKRYKDSDWESGLLINDLIYDKKFNLCPAWYWEKTNIVNLNFTC